MRRRLTNEEREIRAGAGIPFKRWWPILAMFIVWTVAASSTQVFESCLGDPLDGRGRAVGLVRLAAIGPCSPFLLQGSAVDWLVFVAMWAPMPFALLNWRWMKRHRAHWLAVRARDKERRVAKRASSAAAAKDQS